MKQKLLIVSFSLMGALASASADAADRYFPHSGVQCQQADHLANNITDRTQYGIHNTSLTDGVTVECPLNTSELASNDLVLGFGIQAYDRSSSADLSCDVQRIDGNGNVTYTANLTTSGSGSGGLKGPTFATSHKTIGKAHLQLPLLCDAIRIRRGAPAERFP